MKFDFKFSKLRGRIIECYGTVDKFSARIGMTSTTMGKKLSGKSEWTQSEIVSACDLLDIPVKEISAYFFAI